jgi:hypothetical protein
MAGPQLHEKEQQQQKNIAEKLVTAVECTLYRAHHCREARYCCTMYTVPCTSLQRSTLLLYNVHCTVHIIAEKHVTAVQCTLYRAHHCREAHYYCIKYTVPCTSLHRSTLLLYNVHCTVHIIAPRGMNITTRMWDVTSSAPSEHRANRDDYFSFK